jgi:anti-sigma factor RsiW
MQIESNARHPSSHPSICALIDKSLAGAASPQEEQSLREHLASCAPCAEHLEATRRVVAGLEGFSFALGPGLDHQVLAAVALRAQQLETSRIRRLQMGWGSLLALLLTAAGSFAASRLGSLAAPALHLDPAQMRFGLAAFWITPSLFICMLLLLLPTLHGSLSNKKGFSL